MEVEGKGQVRDRRARRSARTRKAILDAAGVLFAERGYSATTIDAIAEAADVAVETVYARFKNKRSILAAYLDVSVVGDDNRVPLLERDEVRAVAVEADQHRQVRLLAHLARTILERADPAQQVLHGAAASDRSLEELISIDDQRRRITHRAFIDMLIRNGPLRPGLSVEDATDTYSALSNPGTYSFMTCRRRWTPDKFEKWIGDCFETLLLPKESPIPKPSPPRRGTPPR